MSDMKECPAVLASFTTETTTITWFLTSLVVLLVVRQLQQWNVVYHLKIMLEFLRPVPLIAVELTDAEARDDGVSSSAEKKRSLHDPEHPGFIQCFDPSTGQYLGQVKAMTAQDVHEACVKAAAAQKEWSQTTFAQRRRVLRTLQHYVVHHVHDICRVSSRDSGKPVVDACLGEILTTTEKIRTLNAWGELWLQPSYRPTGPLMMHKIAMVEYVPLGVIAPIAPWNYP
jgi:delta 1-pyrroline-5-carboxylate dehydrogenase